MYPHHQSLQSVFVPAMPPVAETDDDGPPFVVASPRDADYAHAMLSEKKPKRESAVKSERKFPKIRVSLEVFEHLKRIQRAYRLKSFCEVVSTLLASFDAQHSTQPRDGPAPNLV